MPKAVKITKANQNALEQQYNLEPEQLDNVIGMYLIAEFGESMAISGFLTPERFGEVFSITDQKLANGYVDVVFKAPTA